MPWQRVDADSYNIAIPLYYQVQTMLLDRLFKGLEPGDMLPTEKELCEIYQVSRSTMRQALDFLVKEGYIERFKGKGTFLKRKPHPSYSIGDRRGIPTINLTVPAAHPSGVVSQSIAILDSRALSEGYLLTFTNLDNDIETLKKHLRNVLASDAISGAIYYPIIEPGAAEDKNAQIMQIYREMGVPFVVIDRLPFTEADLKDSQADSVVAQFTALEYDFVVSDNLHGGYLATRHMLELGHRKIAYVGAYLSHPSFLRQEGYRKALREFDGESSRVIRDSGLLSSDSLRRKILQELRASGITGIFAAFDILAQELLRTALSMGIRIPEELSVAGYDDLDFCEYLEVPLTSVKQPVEDQLKMALEILFQKIRQKSPILRHVILPVELKVRKSTGVAPGSESAAKH